MRTLFAAVALIVFISGISPAAAQTPSTIIVYKGFGYEQASATELVVKDPGFLISVDFATPVSANTVVQLRGPTTYTFTRISALKYEVGRSFTVEQVADLALPDGSYTVAVSGGGTASNTTLVITSRPRIQPVLITNFAELQSLSSGTFRVAWEGIAGAFIDDFFSLTFTRSDLQIFSSPNPGEPGALNGRSTFFNVNNLAIAPGESLEGGIVFARYTFSSANNNATTIGSGYGFYSTFPIKRAALTPPVIAAQPQPVTVAAGSTAVFNVEAAGTGLTYQWRRNGALIAGATSSTLILGEVQAASAGDYSVFISNPAGSFTSTSAALTVAPPGPPSRIVNLAIRTASGSGSQTLIVGFVVGGEGTTGSKPLLVRAVGPTLGGFGVPGVLADPRLELFSNNVRIAENDNWSGDTQVTAIGSGVGAFALSSSTSRDAALYAPSLASTSYSAQITGVGGATGVVLAEVYDATSPGTFDATTPRLINVSARSNVGTGADVLIAGFVIAGPTARTVLIRGLGPSLTSFGVAGALADPRLTLFAGPAKILENDDWGGNSALAAVFMNVGAFALQSVSRDAALLVTLPPGNYSAQLSGANSTTGVGLVEVYEVR
ncbi:MAG: immunoglobulin domain-containing protein [Opitutaceae bacterium]|nr:immunoglobulin domain-containing protein [Opitutaceae bacterium]